jgi:hypothetical protein
MSREVGFKVTNQSTVMLSLKVKCQEFARQYIYLSE